jgi:hypothetical protein
VLPGQEQPSTRAQVQRPEDRPPGVAATEDHSLGLASRRPSRSQRREQQQIDLVLGQHHASRWQPLDLQADPPLFSPAVRGRGPGGSAVASRRSPAGAGRGGGCRRRRAACSSVPGVPGATGRSTPWRTSRGPAVIAAGVRASGAGPPGPRGRVAPSGSGCVRRRGHGLACTPRPTN